MDNRKQALTAFPPDPLTGASNQRAFFNWLLLSRKSHANLPFTLVALDLNNLRGLNASRGLDAGDDVLRWVTLVMKEETRAPVYRIGGDEFVIVLVGDDQGVSSALAHRVLDRLNKEGPQVHLQPPVATIAVIHFRNGQELLEGNIIGEIDAAISETKSDPTSAVRVFEANDIQPSEALYGMIRDLINQLEQMTTKLDEMRRLAHTDHTTGLPNIRAALQELETAVVKSRLRGEPLAILLIDGDDLGRYNEMGYSLGDEMIRNLGMAIQNQVRGSDFVARWRMGDEFVVLLPSTSIDEATSVAERIRSAIENASKAWPLPVTISTGLAAFPDHSDTLSELLYHAEEAKGEAKRLGKNRVVRAG